MFEKVANWSKTVDMPLNEPVYIGDKKMKDVKLNRISYNREEYKKEALAREETILVDYPEGVEWIQVIGLHEEEIIKQIGEELYLHPLTVEDILNMSQNPKFEEYDDYIFMNTKHLLIEEDELVTEQIAFILKDNIVLTFMENESQVFSTIERRISENSPIRKYGSDILLYSLFDAIVDDYFLVLGKISEDIDEIEDTLLSKPDKDLLQEIYKLKRDLIYMRKILWPMRNIASNLSINEYDDVSKKTVYYFRDIYDHIIQMIDIIETYRDICSGMLDTYLSSLGNKTNDVMKILTIFSTISVPLTFLTGVYGMNFAYQPELQWRYAYPVFWILSVLITLAMLKYFRDKDWI